MKKIYIAALAMATMLTSLAQKIDRTKPPVPGAAPVLSIKDPVQYKLSNGITVLVVENHKLPKVSASYIVDYGPVTEGDKAGVMSLMGSMLEEGTTSMTKAAFDETVDQMGANVNLSSRGGNASALTRYFDKSFMLMSDALLHPAFPAKSFDKIKSQMITGLRSNEKSAKAISSRVVNALNFGSTHASGEFETEQTINSITQEDVKQFYNRYISPSRGYLTFIGDIKPEHAKELAEKYFGTWKGSTVSLENLPEVKNPAITEIDIIDVPNAVQSEITVTNLVTIPMSSPDYFPALLANHILGGGAEGRLFMNLREKHGYTYGAYSAVGTGRFQALFNASASVRNEKADSAVMEILKEIRGVRTARVTDEELKNAKALYAGNFALSLEDPARTASFASNIIVNNLPKDFYRTYLQKINAVTADDIQRVAKKYFGYDNSRIIVVGKASVVKPGLVKTGYPVNMYDRFAKPVTDNTANSKSPASVQPVQTLVTPATIIAKYLAAIGGTAELAKINSVAMTGSMTVQGMNLDLTDKRMAPNMTMMEMTMNGQALMRQVFNGTSGYQMQMGNKKNLEGDDLTESKNTKGIFEQMYYGDAGYTLEMAGTEKVSGNDAYKIIVTSPAGTKTTQYYDINTGYLLKTEKPMKMQGQDLVQTIEFSNYKKTGNVMFPYTRNVSVQSDKGSQDFVMEIKDIKINEGVKADDFK